MMTSCRLPGTTLVGFDSAWADNEKKPGAICALIFDAAGSPRFVPPSLAGFDKAEKFIADLHDPSRKTLVAVDQPMIVPNPAGMRPCERVVASVASWSGGGIQPANREGQGKVAMFGDGAPIWRFLDRLAFVDNPQQALQTPIGGYLLEVFPALALLGLDPAFAKPRAGPRYNPARSKTFRQNDWSAVCDAVAREADGLALNEVAGWCRTLDRRTKPQKRTQDCLDSVICLLVAALWLTDPARCAMVGDVESGYIVAPIAQDIYERLVVAARKNDVRIARPR